MYNDVTSLHILKAFVSGLLNWFYYPPCKKKMFLGGKKCNCLQWMVCNHIDGRDQSSIIISCLNHNIHVHCMSFIYSLS